MAIKNFNLIEKNSLTKDVFELIFEWEEKLDMKPWQFITFLLPNLWWRAYSILELDDLKMKLIIKRVENWRWWSKFICDSQVWTILKWVWPAWHFILQENSKNKLFIWTGTWFVPLYNQIISSIELKLNVDLKLVFWVREAEDLFYIEQLKKLKENHKNFSFEIYLSREQIEWFNMWYTNKFLTKENIEKFEEFYICWAPNMIESSIEILKSFGIKDENIFMEKY